MKGQKGLSPFGAKSRPQSATKGIFHVIFYLPFLVTLSRWDEARHLSLSLTKCCMHFGVSLFVDSIRSSINQSACKGHLCLS